MARWLGSFIFCIFLLTGFCDLAAQTIPLRHFTASDGLSSNLIYSITRERNGYLWLSTDKGVSRYNGQSYKNFTTADGLPDNEIFNIREDYEGRLWLATFNGTLCYYKDGQFHTPVNTPWLKLPLKSSQLISHLLADSSIFIQLTDVQRLIHIRHNQVRMLYTGLNQVVQDIALLPGKRGYKLRTSDRDIDIDTSGKRISEKLRGTRVFFAIASFSLPTDHYLFSDNRVYTDSGKILRRTVKHLPLPPNTGGGVQMFMSGKDLMICGPDGLWINDSLQIPTEQEVLFVEKDSDGNFWFGTKGKGLYQFSRFFREQVQYQQAYKGQAIYAKIVGKTLFFTNNAGDLYRLADKKMICLIKAKNRNVNHKRAYFLIDDRGTFFTISTHSSLLMRLQQTVTKARPILLANINEFKTLIPKDSFIYAFGSQNFYRIPYSWFQPYPSPPLKVLDSVHTFSTDRIHAAVMDHSDQSLWYTRTNVVYRITDTASVPQPQLGKQTFRQMAFAGTFFAGITESNAMVLANRYKEPLVLLDTVPESDCVWEDFYPIDQQHILITTNNYHRLLTFLPTSPGEKPRYRLETIEDPFIPQQVDAIAVDSNNCFFLKDGNILQVATHTLFERTPLPRPVITSFQTIERSYPLSQDIIVPYSESGNINIAFDNINFSSTEVSCEYSVSRSKQAQWIPLTGNAINLSAPGSGQYTLRIRSKTISSGYCLPIVLSFTIEKPFWATWWFLTICGAVFIALVWLAILLVAWIKIRRKQRQHEADMKYQQSEYKALNALMNPHFIFNSLNNIQGLINKDEKRIANEYLVIFSDLVRQNMHNVSRGFISLQQELNLVENYLTLEKLRFKDLIHYEMRIDEEVDADDIMIPPLMIQPLVENAVKHGLLPRQSTNSKVTVTVYEKANKLYIEITDNGIGITQSLESQSHLHESFGLSNLKKRTEHLKKIQQRDIDIEVSELKDVAGQVAGTRALITITLENL
ncbi:sensor histidine kinase [Taibaiella koreensis]|uniref:sensor histidine kinase n=1 Tax=Taibaiella koreensis TaxID=1268548 RepID=UPI000E59CB3E|nr:histidine kinase [Taibaiella koreensis]